MPLPADKVGGMQTSPQDSETTKSSGGADGPFEGAPTADEPRLGSFGKLLHIIDRLRAPDGCPWDRKQTLESMAPNLIEEAFEVVEAIELEDRAGTLEELGDVLLVVTLMARIAEDEGRFDLGQVAERVADKLVRRHPHVFGQAQVDGADQVVSNWERIKREERREADLDTSALAGVPLALPALQRTQRLSKKATATGFRWDNPEGALRKVEEEVAELREAFEAAGCGSSAEPREPTPEERAHLEHELGDLLIAAGFLGQYIGIDPERAARGALRRFEKRFRHMEAALGEKAPQADLTTWMSAWRAAKVALAEEEEEAGLRCRTPTGSFPNESATQTAGLLKPPDPIRDPL